MSGRIRNVLLGALAAILIVLVAGYVSKPDPRAILREYGWSPKMWLTEGQTVIGVGPGWYEALSASKSVGLDFSDQWGADATEQTYDVGPVGASLLLVNERAVGAWLTLPAPDLRRVPLDYPVAR